MQVRRDRPVRELTCDDVNRSLSRQEVLLAGLVQKLQRGTGLVCVDNGKLQDVKQKLLIALKDKVRMCCTVHLAGSCRSACAVYNAVAAAQVMCKCEHVALSCCAQCILRSLQQSVHARTATGWLGSLASC